MNGVFRFFVLGAYLVAAPASAVSVFSAGVGGFISVVGITGGPSSVSFTVDAPVEASDTSTMGGSGANVGTNLDIVVDPSVPAAVAAFSVSTDGFAVAAPGAASASGFAFGLLSGSVANLTADTVMIDFATNYSIFAFSFVDDEVLETASGFASMSVESSIGGISNTLFTRSVVASSLLEAPVSGQFLFDQTGDFSLVLLPGETSVLTAIFFATGDATAAPIPLPATVWLLLAGVGALCGLRRKASALAV